MKRLLQAISVLSVCLLASNVALATKVKMKTGQVIEGTIKGLVVQREKVEKSPSKDNPSKAVYSARYSLTNGEDRSR
jgi:hypothetical protein